MESARSRLWQVDRAPRRWAERSACRVATERPPDVVRVCSMLERERQDDGGVPRVGVRLIPGFVVVEKKFSDTAIGQARDGRRETQTSEFKREVLGPAPAGKPLTLRHSAASLVSRGA